MSCYIDKPIPRPQNPESAGRNPTDVTLDRIAQDFFLRFNEFENLNETEKMIEEKYDIKKENGCWPDDDIKQAWEETQQMNKMEREEWAIVIILQIVKRSLVQSDLKEKLVQSYEGLHLTDVGPKADDGLCSSDRPAERSYQSNAEQKTAGADEQLFGAGLKPSQCKLTEESDPASESKLSIPSSDVASSSKLRGKKQVDGRQSTTDIKQASFFPTKRTMSERNPLFPTMGPAEGDEQHSGENTTTYDTETSFADSNPSRHSTGVPENTPENIDETIYIPIPLSVMFFSEPTVEHQCPNVQSRFKLINGAPSNIVFWEKKSYVISFNNRTRNAAWVYEILNRATSVNNCVQERFGDPYVRGHLAAAANHRWCWEAHNDANLMSNMVPQHRILNTGPWKKLENWCRDLREKTGVCNVHVYSGPLYREMCRPFVVHLRGKEVPTHLFKVIIVENDNGTVEEPECYMMPNKNPLYSNLKRYRVAIRFLQDISGLTFIERRNVGETERILTATLQGEGVNSTQQSVNIRVRISQ